MKLFKIAFVGALLSVQAVQACVFGRVGYVDPVPTNFFRLSPTVHALASSSVDLQNAIDSGMRAWNTAGRVRMIGLDVALPPTSADCPTGEPFQVSFIDIPIVDRLSFDRPGAGLRTRI